MNRFTSLAAACAVSLIGLPAMAQHEITWWDFLAGGDGVRMRAMIDQFNAEHPDINITPTTSEWGVPFYTRVRTSAAVGQGPDIMTYHLSRIPLALQEGILTPITDADLQAADLAIGDFFETAVDAASDSDGTLYAVPFDIHSIVLYYNRSYFEGSEFLDDDGTLTGINSLEDFERALAHAAEAGSRTPLSYQTGGAGGIWRVFYTLMGQQGGELIVDGEVLPGDNAQKAQRAIEIMANWGAQGWQPEQAEYPASVALFTSGQSAFHLNGVWEVPTLNDLQNDGSLGFEWGAVQVPQLLDQEATWADSHAFALPIQGNQEMDPERRAAVMTVIGWMQRHAIAWADAGHIPAYRPVAESDAYLAMEPNATYASLADTAYFDPRSQIAGVASPVYDAGVNVIGPAMHGFMSPEDAVAQMRAELQALIR
ncbi:extracellular solute-binding protein [Roseinatronobacter alkalisoli]|uniref:Extracellular solute-binding protein n=1 Tax=Roseinatronobacter alkalisoli TaxID=3028235 RepID=A0ABT5TEL7_9RHOB|nr:extracellular solute-binding protein [Roseinatronobacter sp. HJB301]MDD7973572.1 extracellular solute-binding protein [Roseinatronobacter sp. HJB301]